MKIVILLLIAALLILGGRAVLALSDRTNRTPVGSFDLKRYMGRWFEIARYDNRFERGLDQVQAFYDRQADGRITVMNSGEDVRTGKRRESRGRVHATRIPGRLRVAFFWKFYADYNILELGEGYEWALVGGGSSKYLWILARTPVLPSASLSRILSLAEARGYDTGRLLFVSQAE